MFLCVGMKCKKRVWTRQIWVLLNQEILTGSLVEAADYRLILMRESRHSERPGLITVKNPIGF